MKTFRFVTLAFLLQEICGLQNIPLLLEEPADAVVRNLQDTQYAFLVSNIDLNNDWCVTATNGVNTDDRLGFRKCSFTLAPPLNQLWSLGSNGTMQSALNPSKCMVVNKGAMNIFNGVKVHIGDCTDTTALNQFVHNGTTDNLKVSNTTFCITNRGRNANKGDTILAQTCKTKSKFLMTYKVFGSAPPVTNTTAFTYFKLQLSNSAPFPGCLTIPNGDARKGKTLRLGTCNSSNQTWRLDENGLLHSKFNDFLCIQAGKGSARKRTQLRLSTCDENSKRQMFQYASNNKVSLKGKNLCVAFRGRRAQKNDPIILKKCNNRKTPTWLQDIIPSS